MYVLCVFLFVYIMCICIYGPPRLLGEHSLKITGFKFSQKILPFQECTCLQLEACGPCPDCSECTSCTSCCENPCIDCNNCYNWCSAPSACAPGPLCDCSSCTCSCTTPECSTINCLCCEITIKGRGPQGDT